MVSYLVYQPCVMSQDKKKNPYYNNPQGILFDIAHNGRLNLQRGDFLIFLSRKSENTSKAWFCQLVFKVAEVLPWVFVDYSDPSVSKQKHLQYQFGRLDNDVETQERGCLTTVVSTTDYDTFQPQEQKFDNRYDSLEVTGILSLFPSIRAWLSEQALQHHSLKIIEHHHIEQLVEMIRMRAKNYGRICSQKQLMTVE